MLMIVINQKTCIGIFFLLLSNFVFLGSNVPSVVADVKRRNQTCCLGIWQVKKCYMDQPGYH